MDVEFSSQGIERPARIRVWVEARLTTALRRVARRVDRVWISLRDLNGPRGGVDIELKVEVTLRGAASVRISERAVTVAEALSQATPRLRRAVQRSLSRADQRRRAVGPAVA